MSWAEDREAERLGAIEDARAHIAYGKKFPARQLAMKIIALRKMLLKEYGTLSRALDALDAMEDLGVAHLFGIQLLQVALVRPKALGLVAEAFGKLEDEPAVDHRAAAIITAYKDCGPQSFPPTFGELKRAFIRRFGETRWRGDFPVRKTLRSLRLPLSKSKRGRPIGSRSQI